jgi:hypothetical protein
MLKSNPMTRFTKTLGNPIQLDLLKKKQQLTASHIDG